MPGAQHAELHGGHLWVSSGAENFLDKYLQQ